MTITSKTNATVTATTSPSIGPTSLAAKLGKVLFNRSVAIIWWTGLAALMAGFRLATNSGAEGEEMFRAWMIDWALIWFTLAALSLRLLKPIFDYVINEQSAHAEAAMVRELSKLEPSFAQELRSMTMHQQLRDEQAVEQAQASSEALPALGGLTTATTSKPMSAIRLDSRLSSAR
jgi:hypothetical protein